MEGSTQPNKEIEGVGFVSSDNEDIAAGGEKKATTKKNEGVITMNSESEFDTLANGSSTSDQSADKDTTLESPSLPQMRRQESGIGAHLDSSSPQNESMPEVAAADVSSNGSINTGSMENQKKKKDIIDEISMSSDSDDGMETLDNESSSSDPSAKKNRPIAPKLSITGLTDNQHLSAEKSRSIEPEPEDTTHEPLLASQMRIQEDSIGAHLDRPLPQDEPMLKADVGDVSSNDSIRTGPMENQKKMEETINEITSDNEDDMETLDNGPSTSEPPVKKSRSMSPTSSNSRLMENHHSTTSMDNNNMRSVGLEQEDTPDEPMPEAAAANASSVEKEAKGPWLGRRPYTVPTGLKRTPFHVRVPMEDFRKVFSQLKVEEDVDFPVCAPTGLKFEREKDGENDKPYLDLLEDPDVTEDFLNQEFHAEVGDYQVLNPDDDYMGVVEKEELIWSPSEVDFKLGHDQAAIGQLYDSIEENFLVPIWRQFEGRIPSESALLYLKKCNYDVPKALDTIDECLKVLPQKMKDPCVAQVQLFQLAKDGDTTNLRELQENVMRNYHMSEIHNYACKFRKFYGVDIHEDEDPDGLSGKVACNCLEPKCREMAFEPRYGCKNCTKTLRKIKLRANLLCLICKTYTKMTGKTRPAETPVFDEDDMERIRLWDTNECKKMNRETFDKWHQAQKNVRYRKLELTMEETLMLNYPKLMRTQKGLLGDVVCSMLQPFVLPHFSLCQCAKSGSIPIRSANFGKETFSPEETESFKKAIMDNPGDIKSAATTLGVEQELVEIFLNTHKVRDPIWTGVNLRDQAKFHRFAKRQMLPLINAPPALPRK